MENEQQPTPNPTNTGLSIAPPTLGPDYSANLQGYKVYKRAPDTTKKIVLWVSVILVLMLVLSAGLYFWLHATTSKNAAKQKANTPATTPTAVGTDDASLQQNVDDLSKSVTQGDQDQTSLNTAVNDKQSQIDVPTN